MASCVCEACLVEEPQGNSKKAKQEREAWRYAGAPRPYLHNEESYRVFLCGACANKLREFFASLRPPVPEG